MDKDVVIIEADRPERDYWLALWSFRNLFLQLTWKDLRLRYRQTLVGLNWVFVRPLVPMLILVLVFGTFAGFSSAGVPYALFADADTARLDVADLRRIDPEQPCGVTGGHGRSLAHLAQLDTKALLASSWGAPRWPGFLPGS